MSDIIDEQPSSAPEQPSAAQVAMKQAQQHIFAGAGTLPGGVQDNLPLASGLSLEEQAVAKQKRQEAATFSDNAGSMWRQDGIANGIVAHIAGQQMVPDPKWNPFEPAKWKELSAGIQDDLLPALYDTRSEAHAHYVRDLLLDKQQDQQRLGDLGGWGTAGRFAFGAVLPDQMLAGMVGGRVAQGLKYAQIVRSAATAAPSVTPLLAGMAGGAAFNASFEKVRQSYNFENDSTHVLEAGLMGAALAVPFSLLHIRDQRRIADTQARDSAALEAVQSTQAGHEVSPQVAAMAEKAVEHNKMVKSIEDGHLMGDEAMSAYDKFHEDEASETRGNLETYLPAGEEAPANAAQPMSADDAMRMRMGDALYAAKVRRAGDEEAAPTSAAPVATASLQGEVPSGFLPGSLGAAQHMPVDAATTAFSKARLDIFATLNKSENPYVRAMGDRLVKDAIQVDAHDAQGWTASEYKSHLVRTIKGEAMTEMRDAYSAAIKARGVSILDRVKGNFEDDFHNMVTRVTRGDATVLKENPDIAPMLSKASAAQRRAYDRTLAEATAEGVHGTDTLTPHDNYVNRQWDHQKIREAEMTHGPQAVQRLLAEAIRVPGFTGDMEKAGKFLKAVKKMEFSNTMHDVMLHGQDMATLREALAKHNDSLKPHDIDSIIDTMFEKRPSSTMDAGTTPRLKYRFDLDENHTVATKAGQLRISDLTENDARYLLDSYMNTMAGHTALAKMGIKSKADWDAKMGDIRNWFDANVTKGDKAKRDLRYLEDIYSNITGKPMSTHDFSTTARTAAAIRAYGRSAFLGQLGFAAAFELKQAAALFGFKSMLQHMPSLGQFLKSFRNGHIADSALSRDIENMVGFGHEMAMSYARHAEIQEAWGHRALNKFENFGNKASHTVDILSGNAGLTSMTRNWSAQGFVQKASDWARTGRISDKWRERMVGWGVSQEDLDHVLAKLKEHSEVTSNGRVEGINYENWAKDSHETYEKFQLAVSRAARDAVQDHDLGETMMWQHSTLGKVFGELKTFMLVAHAKNMLKNAHYKDATAFQVYSVGLLGEALGYMTQTAANYATNPAELEKRLTAEKIAKAAWFRMASAGVLPAISDIAYTAATGHSMVPQGGTANTDNRSLIPPSLVLAGKAMDLPRNLTGLLTGAHVVTQQNVRDMASLIPGARLMGAAQLINEFATTFPKNAPPPPK